MAAEKRGREARAGGNKSGPSHVHVLMPISTWRRYLAQGLLAAPGAFLVAEGAFRHPAASEVFFGGFVLAGAALLGRRSVVTQVLARGAAWSVAAPCLLGTAIMLLVERRVPDLGIVATAAAASAALLLTRPMLETAEAKAAFAPLAARRWLLLASTAAVTASAALGTLLVELGSMPWHALPSLAQWVGLPLLAASLVASAVGVARMRAWGILLGAVTSVLALAVGAAAHDRMLGLVLASTAVPGATMVGAILAARARASASASRASPGLRIASAPEPAVEPARLRIPTDEDLDVPEIEPARAPERLRA